MNLTVNPASLTADELDKRITVAFQTDALEELHVLVEERLGRNEAISGASRRLMLLRQAADLDIIREKETWRLGDNDTFFAYLQRRKQEYVERGYDAEADLLVVKEYSTIEAWCNIIRHYHERHGYSLETLAGILKTKLEVASGTCNLWDAAHDNQIDPDMEMLLFDASVSNSQLLARYSVLKGERGEDAEVDDDSFESIDGGREGINDFADGGVVGENDFVDSPVEDDNKESERDYVGVRAILNTETGIVSTWIRRGRSDVRVKLGRFDVQDPDLRQIILGLCEEWRVTLE